MQITETAEADIDAVFQYLFQHSPTAAFQFREELANSIRSLDQMPQRCSVAQESDYFHREVRQLIYKHGKTAYRVLYVITESETMNAVSILRVRQGRLLRLGETVNERESSIRQEE